MSALRCRQYWTIDGGLQSTRQICPLFSSWIQCVACFLLLNEWAEDVTIVQEKKYKVMKAGQFKNETIYKISPKYTIGTVDCMVLEYEFVCIVYIYTKLFRIYIYIYIYI